MKILNLFRRSKYKEIKKELEANSEMINGVEISKELIGKLCLENPEKCHLYKKIFFNVYKDISTKEAILYAEDYLKVEFDLNVAHVLVKRYKNIGYTSKEYELLKKIDNHNIKLKESLILNENVKDFSIVLNKWKFNDKNFIKELQSLSRLINDESLLKKYIVAIEEKFSRKTTKINYHVFTTLKDSNTNFAVTYGLKYINKNKKDIKFIRPLIKRLERLNRVDDILNIARDTLVYVNDDELKHLIFNHSIKEDIKSFFKNVDKSTTIEESNNQLHFLKEKYKNDLYYLYRNIYEKYTLISYENSLYYAQEALKIKYNEFIIKDIYDLHIRYGSIFKAYEVLPKDIYNTTLQKKADSTLSLIDLYKNGFDLKLVKTNNYSYVNNKIFYLLHNRLPYNSGGYATRTHGLLTETSKLGWNMNGISRLGYPWDKMPEKESRNVDVIDQICYHRLFKEGIGLGKLPLKNYLEEYAKELLKYAISEKPQIIHSASNYMNGVVGNYVAKCLGIKSVYEVRGLWEITRISRQPEWKNTEYYNLMVKMETEAAKGADIVLTLTEALKKEMISRGVDSNKIIILPNGVTSNRFSPEKRNQKLEKELDVKGKVVIGYIGSIVEYEGLEYLVSAVKLLVEKNITNIAVLIVGDGAVLEFLKNEVKKNELNEFFIFTGRIPHEKVESYYSLIDITPFPRKGNPVCEMVSPLKPFEAMSMEKSVIASSVNALTEIIKDNFNGLIFEKDNIEDLADKLEYLIEDTSARERLGKNARNWTIEYRDWKVITKTLSKVYQNLTSG